MARAKRVHSMPGIVETLSTCDSFSICVTTPTQPDGKNEEVTRLLGVKQVDIGEGGVDGLLGFGGQLH
jgi:hypothetical protein